MSNMIVMRLEGETDFLLVDVAAGVVRPLDHEEAPTSELQAGQKLRGVAEAYALPQLPDLSSRKFFVS